MIVFYTTYAERSLGLAALGTAPHVIEKLINHITGTLSGVAGIYNRFKYEKECRAAIEAWESKLQAVLQTSDAQKAA